MFYTKVDEVPRVKMSRKRLYVFFDEFMSENIKAAKVRFNENDYVSVKTAYTSLRASIISGGYPIDVFTKHGEIYLVRRDI